MGSKANDVFINCPFDQDYSVHFRALVFSIKACGFRVRCALEMEDGGETRIEKLYRIIEDCRYSVHDLSRTQLDPINHLPRFNMPLELGIFLGAKRFGEDMQKRKRSLILDIEQYRYQKFISDLAGMDIKSHNNDDRNTVKLVRDWLVTVSSRRNILSPDELLSSYDRFSANLPLIARLAGLDEASIIFADFERLVLAWIKSGHGLVV